MTSSNGHFEASLWLCLSLFLLCMVQIDAQYTSPTVYPSPPTLGLGGWQAAFLQAQAFVSNLTLSEKENMVTGVNGPCVGSVAPVYRLAFPGLCLQDGPLAIRQANLSSVFSAGISAAATWDNELMNARGVAIGAEFKAKGANIALGPVAGPLGRSALGGRNWEGFSPDPYLTGQAFAATIQGFQSSGVQACMKHFIGYEQETQRFPDEASNGVSVEAVSSNIDDRTMHELYLWPFADGVRGGAASVMCSYNRINGTYACENSKALNGLLKEELGFQGYVVSDWGGTKSGANSINGGLDMDMPGGDDYFGAQIGNDIGNGAYSMARLDDMITRVMTPYFYLLQNESYPNVDPTCATLNGYDFSSNPYDFDLSGSSNRDVRGNHYNIIRQMGADSAVLLKNTAGALPLSTPKQIGVFGYDADAFAMSNGEAITISGSPFAYQKGSLPVGGGSGTGRLSYVVSPISAIQAKAATYGANVQSITDNPTIINNPVNLNPMPDVCLVFVKTWAAEGSDRSSLVVDWDGDAVIEKIASVCDNTIVISNSAGLNIMDWADNANVTAIIAGHLPGQEIGNSIVDILWGAVNPSGKLPYTIAYSATDYNAPIVSVSNADTTNAFESNFTEGLLIDYRHFDQSNITPRFEFGFGLSYTTFSATAFTLQNVYNGSVSASPPQAMTVPGGNPHLYDTILQANCTVSNTGNVDGKAVIQLYLSLPSTAPAGTPVQVLRGYNKVQIAANQSVSVTFPIVRRDISYWDVVSQNWIIPSGDITVRVGFSSRDVQASQSITVIT